MQSKIFWYGFKRNLCELYHLLLLEKLISCSEEEFLAHFTGKKFRHEYKAKGIISLKEPAPMVMAVNHLMAKGFLQDSQGSIGRHFGLAADDFKQSTMPAKYKSFQRKLELLFPETSGLRCKTRLYYKARNSESLLKVLKDCGLNP